MLTDTLTMVLALVYGATDYLQERFSREEGQDTLEWVIITLFVVIAAVAAYLAAQGPLKAAVSTAISKIVAQMP